MQQLKQQPWDNHASSRPQFAELLDRARALGPQFSATAAQTEADQRVPGKSMDLLRDAELFKLVKPAAFGGFEYGPAEAAQIAFEIGRADGSTGWCGSLAIYFHLTLAYFPYAVQDQVYSSGNDLIAASYMPSRDCTVVDGGYEISGSWAYASNCDNAGWLMVAALVPAAEQPPVLTWMLAPAHQFTIDHGSWNVAGMQGTGSKSLRSNGKLFIPSALAIRVADIMSGNTPGAAIAGNTLAHFRHPTFGPTCLVAPILGMAQGALDAYIDNARQRVRQVKLGMVNPVSGNSLLQSRIGQASAAIDAAKALLLEALADGARKVRAGQPLDQRERIVIRRNQGFAADTAVRVVNDLFAHNGTAGAAKAAPLQRYWRDANAAALHVSLDWEAISAMYGQTALDLEPVGTY